MALLRIIAYVVIHTLITLSSTNSENIVVFHHVATYSHRVPTMTLAEALTQRGHNVTFLAPFYPKHPNPNITEIIPLKLAKYVEQFLNDEFDISLRVRNEMEPLINNLFRFGYDACEALYSSEEFQRWNEMGHQIDLVIIDNCMAECGVGLAYKYSAKYVIFNTVVNLPYAYDAFGFSPESASVPEMEVGSPAVPMGFFTRVSNALMSIRWKFAYSTYSVKLDRYIRNALKVPDMPFIEDLVRNVSLIFYTGDVVTDYPRALPPNFVNVAGIHCKKSTEQLPEDIENFIKVNKTDPILNDGFVYISLGSLVDPSNLPENIQQVFFIAIKSFPNLKFVWKWGGDWPKEIPSNLYLRKWFPQVDILGHPRIRAFLTQGGRPSSLEALFNGVPLISIPVLGDQDFNVNRLVNIGASVKLEFGTVTVTQLKEAIRQQVYDPRAKARMTKLQKIFLDRPMSPLDTAVWWTEYILRTDDASHLRPSGFQQNWLVRRQIDVWAFMSISILVSLIAFGILLCKIAQNLVKLQPILKLKDS